MTYGTPSRQEQERMARVREMVGRQNQMFGPAYGPGLGPAAEPALMERRGVADSVPQRLLTPEQATERNTPQQLPEIPRVAKQGKVWDQTFNRGEGGYGDRAPSPHALAAAQGTQLNHEARLESMARAFGIDPSAYTPETSGQLEGDIAALRARHEERSRNYDTIAVPGGGFRYTPNAAMKQRMEDRRGDQIVETLWNRWHQQAKDAGIPYDQFYATYNAGEGLSPTQRAANLQRLLAPLKAAKRAQISDSIKQRVEQQNAARRENTSIANIVFRDSLQNAKTPEDVIRVLLGGHVQNPYIGLGNAASMMQRGLDDLAAQKMMGEQAAASTPGAKADRDLQAILGNKTGPALLAELQGHIMQRQPQGVPADPAMIANQVLSHANRHSREIAGRGFGNWSPEDTAYMQKLAQLHVEAGPKGNAGFKDRQVYTNWANSLGLSPTDPQVQAAWKHITGGGDVRTPMEWFEDNTGINLPWMGR